jgi:hypothetical protein
MTALQTVLLRLWCAAPSMWIVALVARLKVLNV